MGNWEATLKAASNAIQVSPPADFPSARVLRRAQILRLIDQEPSKRYEALGKYIEIPGVSKCEDTLRKATKTCQDEFNQAVRDLRNATQSVQELWEKENKPGKDAESWAATEATKDITAIEKYKISAEEIITSLNDLKYKRANWVQKQSQLQAAAESVTTAINLLKAEEAASSGQGRTLI